MSDNALTNFGRFVHAVAVTSEVDVLAWAGRQDAAAFIAKSREIVISEGAALAAGDDDPATVAFRGALLDELHTRAMAEDAMRAASVQLTEEKPDRDAQWLATGTVETTDAERDQAQAELAKQRQAETVPMCDADGHEDRPAVAVLVYVGQGEHIGAAICRECAACKESGCDKLGDVMDAEYEEPWCRPHADQFGPRERVSGPDIVRLDSDRYRVLIVDGDE